MKRSSLLVVVAMLAISTLALAAYKAPDNQDSGSRQILGGLWVGKSTDTVNRITRTLGGSTTFDFPSQTTTCTDSTAFTVTGAKTDDPCFTSMPASPAANSIFTCYVSAADTVRVRFCPVGTAVDPASALYAVRIISSS